MLQTVDEDKPLEDEPVHGVPLLEYEFMGQPLYNKWKADGTGLNIFNCPHHGNPMHAWCKACVEAKDKMDKHVNMVEQQAELENMLVNQRQPISSWFDKHCNSKQ